METYVSHVNFQTSLAAELKATFGASKVTVAHYLVQMEGLLRLEVEVTFHAVRMLVRIGLMVLHLADGFKAKSAALEGTKYPSTSSAIMKVRGHDGLILDDILEKAKSPIQKASNNLMKPGVDRKTLRFQSIPTVVVPSENGCLNSLIFDLICMYLSSKVAANHHLLVLRFSPKLRYRYKY